MTIEELHASMAEINKVFGPEKIKAVPMFENCLRYEISELAKLSSFSYSIQREKDQEKRAAMIRDFSHMRDSVKENGTDHRKIFLWPEGVYPELTDYKSNADFMYNHNPGYIPYMYEMLIPEDKVPKGAVIVCAGGDHGECVLTEGYQVCLDLNALGYQCFLLLNRTNHNPWNERESGADAARAIRIIRKNSSFYRIAPDHIAFAGFSNGGLTGEACIEYYSGAQTMTDQFHDYIPDDLDLVDATPDAFLCIYGPRFKGAPFDYTGVKYPPVFFAVGREDNAMDNLNYVYPDLIAHGIKAEIHTFAGTPHGQAGVKLIDGKVKYQNFELWYLLADAFMMDVYKL
jgi:acetyl esterase/lipase